MSQPKRRARVETCLPSDEVTVYTGLVRNYLVDSNHPQTERLMGMLRARDFAGLLKWSELPCPQMYDTPASYFADAQVAALIKKYPFTVAEIPGIAPEETAIRKFASSEHRCKWVNRRFRAKRNRFDNNARFWGVARTFIERCIGSSPDLPSIMKACDFTAGANVGIHGNKTNLARKLYADKWSCTPSALPYAMTALWLNIHARDCILPGTIKCYDPDLFRDLVRQRVEFTNENKVTFVPKTATTHRSIACEPILNGIVQKGIDTELKRLLAKVGVNLKDQTRNQTLAYAGSLGTGNPYATIDLSAASDSLAIEVVRDLLPPDWYEFLNSVRSPWYSLHGVSRRYEKFCSMGNGFCFPLQSLIFASVCHASLVETREPVGSFSVYGDDIIVPQNVALLVIERLRDLGFKTNRDKTFVTGPFRESCGRDWFDGQDVRPVVLKDRLTDVRQLCSFHNGTYRSAETTRLFHRVRLYLRNFMPHLLRPGVEPGDTCFSVPLDIAMTSPWVRWCKDRMRWSWKELISRPKLDHMDLTIVARANALTFAVLRGANSGEPFTIRYTSVPRFVSASRPFWTTLRDPVLDRPIISRPTEVVANARNQHLVAGLPYGGSAASKPSNSSYIWGDFVD